MPFRTPLAYVRGKVGSLNQGRVPQLRQQNLHRRQHCQQQQVRQNLIQQLCLKCRIKIVSIQAYHIDTKLMNHLYQEFLSRHIRDVHELYIIFSMWNSALVQRPHFATDIR